MISAMTPTEFVQTVASRLRESLPSEWHGFTLRRSGSQFQLHYGRPQLHYEVWVDRRFDHVEVGLHFEADAETNLRLLDYFDRRLIEVRAESGQPAEAEHWTASWARVHRVVNFERLDKTLAEEVTTSLARMIEVLQPMLDEATNHTIKR